MTERESGIKMAHDDVPILAILAVLGMRIMYLNWLESDWWAFAGGTLMFITMAIFLAARIYHLTHKDEVFGSDTQK